MEKSQLYQPYITPSYSFEYLGFKICVYRKEVSLAVSESKIMRCIENLKDIIKFGRLKSQALVKRVNSFIRGWVEYFMMVSLSNWKACVKKLDRKL